MPADTRVAPKALGFELVSRDFSGACDNVYFSRLSSTEWECIDEQPVDVVQLALSR